MGNIDIVITWVDQEDPVWQKEYLKHSSNRNNGTGTEAVRFRDWSLLRYWFRGIEQFAPWVRYIHFVTCGHVPEWLDVDNPKIKIVRHEDYIPKEYLPVFNSNAIEMMMHQIPDLSEKFIYFNDDFYLIRPTKPSFFFRKEMPCDIAVAKNHHSMTGVMRGITENNMRLLQNDYDLKNSIRKNLWGWFNPSYLGFLKLTISATLDRNIVSLLDTHAPQPYLKSTWQHLWKRHECELIETISHKFRSPNDISHWYIRYWQIASGRFHSKNVMSQIKTYYRVDDKLDEITQIIQKQKKTIIILNDNEETDNIKEVIDTLRGAFEKILPQRSSFEKK